MYQVLSEKGFDFIKESRRCCLSSYVNQDGERAIGYGYRKNIFPGKVITELTALSLLQADIMECEKRLNEIVMIPLAQHRFDAILSLFYDVGPGSPGKKSGVEILKSGSVSPMLTLINDAKFDAASEYFSYWGVTGGCVNFHLREAEKNLFLHGYY
ncbi:lysozyme [Serratia entomophila]|uniref:lysozyme n=1 Tax=Serratia entomophila TaxID=42906 RepID=UPI002179779D|nr:lysozyme [Serratia entomophila]CAI1500377.1 Phage-related lysozyme (muraminidase) [Serratia entomophila]CAI1509286.1 Phage-related lysozyme (muraminidase) [Serratia entomophila]